MTSDVCSRQFGEWRSRLNGSGQISAPVSKGNFSSEQRQSRWDREYYQPGGRLCCHAGGNRLVVPDESLTAFSRAVKRLGYVLPRTTCG